MKHWWQGVLTIAVSVVLAVCPLSAKAQDPFTPKDPFISFGSGNRSCGEFIVAMDAHSPNQVLQANGTYYGSQSVVFREWTQGYFTAYSAAGGRGEPKILAEITGVMVWLKNWCQTDPTKNFVLAVQAYLDSP